MTGDLARQLREGTRASHSLAENMGFIRCFLKGVLDRAAYQQLIANFYYLYTTLETEIAQFQRHPILGQLYFSELHRRQSLAEDLSYFCGCQWQQSLQPSLATNVYLERIQAVAISDPLLLIGHAYTRYLGDLSGGQILKTIAQKGLKLSDGQGTAFYEFEAIADPKAFKVKYRQTLNQLPIDDSTALAIVAEANHAFSLNMQLFQELEGTLIQSIGQLLFNRLTHRFRFKANALPA